LSTTQKLLQAYQKLNTEQNQAVHLTEGPVLVVAGAGTGKTQLLSVRAAHILSQGLCSPQELLCLTFTEAAAQNMKQRIMELVGNQALKIPIYTFHSFAVEMFNKHPDEFFGGFDFSPIDEVLQKQLFVEIFESLAYNNPLHSYHPEIGWSYLGDAIRLISDLKDAGLSPQDFETILSANQKTLESIDPLFQSLFMQNTLKQIDYSKWSDFCQQLVSQLSYQSSLDWSFKAYPKLSQLILESIPELEPEDFNKKSSPIKAFRDQWFNKTTLKDLDKLPKLQATAKVYADYQAKLQAKGLYDFSDMLVELIQAMKKSPHFLASIQEKYSYVMVDEFQDTNGAQMEILYSLLIHPVHENRPNILVVGDDDQAIYKFNKATIENIHNFQETFAEVQVVSLTKNYRSKQEIIDFADQFINQAQERLANTGIDKNLVSQV
jgi:DNA helicase-2/ATP-dependent DNA helicase PcrA